MEVTPCAREASSHAASLLARLNCQRDRAQFCDCVVRQRQSPGQLYHAHRCVLAASSPVLASILSSTGALVELQAPCLSDPVLPLLLDYIYTGALPHTHTQQQYYNLLTAACHLQMDELQHALKAWKQTEVNAADNTNASTGAENQPDEDINNTYRKTVNTFHKCLPLSDTCSVNSLEREYHQYAATADTCDETHSASIYSCIKDLEIHTSSSKNGANHCNREDASTLSNSSTCCSTPESTASANTGSCRRETYLTPQDLIQNIPGTTEVHRVSRVDKEVRMDQFHSAGTVKPETWHKSTEEELVRTVEDRRSLYSLCTTEVQEEETSRAEKTQRLCLTVKSKAEKQTNKKEEDKTQIHHSPLFRFSTSHLKDNVSPSQCSSSSSSSPQPCCGAVPVIRHSSGAAMLQLAGEATQPTYHPVSQASVSSSRAPYSQSDNANIVEGITTKHKNHYGAQNRDYKDSSNQCAIQDLCYKSNADQSDILKQDYDSNNTDYDEHMDNGLSHITVHNDFHANCDSFQNINHTNHLRDDSVPENKDCSSLTRGLKYKTDPSFDDLPSKHQRLDCSDCHDVWTVTATEEQSIHSQYLRAVVSLPVQDSDAGSDSHCEDLCPEGEVKEEHSYSNKCPAEMDRQDSHGNLYGPKTDWYPNLHRAETSTKDAASRQHEQDSDSKDTAKIERRRSVDVCLSVSSTPESCLDNVTGGFSAFERRTPLELEKTPDTEITEPHLTFTMPVDNNMSEPMYTVVGPSYRGHLHYHCLPPEDTHLSYGDSDHKHSHPDHSDQSNDEEEVGTFASPGQSPLRQRFARETTDQVLLLDISSKPTELLVSYKHRSDEGEKWVAFGHKDPFGNGFGQWNEATSAAGVDERKIRARTKCGAESFDEAESKSWVGETNVDERKSLTKELSRPGAEVIHKTGVVEGENQITTSTVCSPPSVPDSVQASVSSTLSVCIPSTLSESMPTNTSAHLSTPVHHPFQCSLCDRSFSQRGSLNRHVRSHLGVRPFPCPRCPMTFSRQYRVTEHMRVHQRCVLGSDFQKPPAS